MKYEFVVTKTVTYEQFVTIEGACSEDEAYDTVMDIVKDDDEYWEIENVDYEIDLDN